MGINLDPVNFPILKPRSLLQIGENGGGDRNGYRPWMLVGTYYARDTDHMYVGLKSEGFMVDRNDAVINWGDNTGVGGAGTDYLRFIFTVPLTPNPNYDPYARGENGLEAMRISFNGNIGAGNYYNNTLFPYKNPARRFEILSDKITAVDNGTPLLRLTHTQQNPATLSTTGKYAEFELLNNGNFAITVRDNTMVDNVAMNLKERFVGINTNNAGNTLEINSQLVAPSTQNGAPQVPGLGLSTGKAGLRFSD